MKKEYECHECGNEFVLEAEKEPFCPRCDSQNLTFEGYQSAAFLERLWEWFRPVINFWIRPWKFFAGRSIKILNSHILMVLSVAVLLVATWQVKMLSGANSTEIFSNFLSVFRNYSSFSILLLQEGRFAGFFPAPLVAFVLLVFIEFMLFETFNFFQWLLGGGADQSQAGLLFSAAIWIPNILLGTFTFVIARGAFLDFWSPLLLTGSIVRMAGWIIAFWCLYIFVGGCFALPEAKIISAVFIPPATIAAQFLLLFIFLFPVNVYLLPFLNLQPLTAGSGLVEVVLQLIFFPFYLLFL